MRIRDLLAVGAAEFKSPDRRASKHTDYSSSSTWAQVLPIQPTSGNLMILLVGGIQSRTLTFPVGWTQQDLLANNGAQTHVLAIKIAGGAEATSFNVTINSTMQGAIDYFELENVDLANTYLDVGASVLQGPGTYASAVSASITIVRPLFSISTALWNDTRLFDPNNGYTSMAPTARMQSAWKNYYAPQANETVTWTKASGADATSTKVNMIRIFGKQI